MIEWVAVASGQLSVAREERISAISIHLYDKRINAVTS
jgi:hypothetical protein